MSQPSVDVVIVGGLSYLPCSCNCNRFNHLARLRGHQYCIIVLQEYKALIVDSFGPLLVNSIDNCSYSVFNSCSCSI